MKSKLLIIFLLFITLISQAQSYFSNDACWTEFTIDIRTNWIEYRSQYFLNGDTLLNGKTYKKIMERTPNNPNQPTCFIGAIREENGKIFKQHTDYETMAAGEFLLYDFTVKVGDTIHSTAPAGDLSRKPIVIKIDTTELITGEKRKRFYFNSSSEWIEGIGSVGGFFSQSYEHATNYKTNHLVCFKQDGTEYFKSGNLCDDGTCCDILASIDKTTMNDPKILLSPNPTKRFIQLDFSKSINKCKTIKLIDNLGSTIEKLTEIGNSNLEIDLNKYGQGLYFVVIEFEKKCEIHKVIKI